MKKEFTGHVILEPGEFGVAVMVDGTVDSSFSLQYGIPLNEGDNVAQYYWTTIKTGGKTIDLNLNNNPVAFGSGMPGVYRFVNNGTDDEQALVYIEKHREVTNG